MRYIDTHGGEVYGVVISHWDKEETIYNCHHSLPPPMLVMMVSSLRYSHCFLIYSHPHPSRQTITNEMGRPHGPGNNVHQSSIHTTPDVSHNLASRQPHVELWIDCSRLTSFDAIAATRQGCAWLCDIATYLLMSCRKHTTKGEGYESQRNTNRNNGYTGNLSTLPKYRTCLLTPSSSLTFHFQCPCSSSKGSSAETVPPLIRRPWSSWGDGGQVRGGRQLRRVREHSIIWKIFTFNIYTVEPTVPST